MKLFVKKLKCERGLTLIEVLLGLTITLFVGSILYGALITGTKAYEKIGIEWKMRDEADLAVTQMQESLYQFKVDDIAENDTYCPKGTCITILNNREFIINTPDGIATESNLFSEKAEDKIEKRIFTIEGDQFKIYSQAGPDIANKELLMATTDAYDFSGSKLYAYCTKKKLHVNSDGKSNQTCEGVTIQVKLVVDNDPPEKKNENDLFFNKIELESQFGF